MDDRGTPDADHAAANGGPAGDAAARLGELQQAMGDIVRQVPRLRRRVMAAAGITIDGAGTSLLVRLGRDGPMTLTALSERTHVDLSFVSRKARALEDLGLVHRGADPVDRRVSVVSLTPLGDEAFTRVNASWLEVMGSLLATWADEDVDAFLRLSRRYADALEDTDLATPPPLL